VATIWVRPEGGGSRIHHSGRMLLRTWKGKIVAQAWPKKRGNNQTPWQRRCVANFVRAQAIAKQSDPQMWLLAMEMAKRTGLYPRDILTKAILTGMLDLRQEDGTLVGRSPAKQEIELFQGARVHRTSNLTLTAATPLIVTWQATLLNPLLLWDVAAPTLLEIPDGCNVARLTSSITMDANAGGYVQALIRRSSDGATFAQANWSSSTASQQPTLFCDTGPIPVIAGEKYLVRVEALNTRAIRGTLGSCFFAIECGFIA